MSSYHSTLQDWELQPPFSQLVGISMYIDNKRCHSTQQDQGLPWLSLVGISIVNLNSIKAPNSRSNSCRQTFSSLNSFFNTFSGTPVHKNKLVILTTWPAITSHGGGGHGTIGNKSRMHVKVRSCDGHITAKLHHIIIRLHHMDMYKEHSGHLCVLMCFLTHLYVPSPSV